MAIHSSILAQGFHGQRSLAGYSPWGCKEWDVTEATEHALNCVCIQSDATRSTDLKKEAP